MTAAPSQKRDPDLGVVGLHCTDDRVSALLAADPWVSDAAWLTDLCRDDGRPCSGRRVVAQEDE